MEGKDGAEKMANNLFGGDSCKENQIQGEFRQRVASDVLSWWQKKNSVVILFVVGLLFVSNRLMKLDFEVMWMNERGSFRDLMLIKEAFGQKYVVNKDGRRSSTSSHYPGIHTLPFCANVVVMSQSLQCSRAMMEWSGGIEAPPILTLDQSLAAVNHGISSSLKISNNWLKPNLSETWIGLHIHAHKNCLQ